MPRNGAGSYILPAGNPVVSNTTISSTVQNNTLSDIAGALTQSISKDGQTVPTANLPMGGFKLTSLAAGNAPGNSLRYEQLFSQGIPSDIASASTVDIGGEYNTFLNVTGNTTITSFGTNYNGPRFLTFKASLTVTHDGTTLVLPGSTDLVTQAGDVAIFIPKCTVSGTPDGWRLVAYLRDDNVPLVNDTVTIASAATLNFTTNQAQFYSITGTTDVTAVTMYEAQPVYATAAGAFKLVNSTSLVVQGGADYVCSVGDILTFIKDASGNVNVFGIIPLANTANDPTWASDSASKGASTQWVNAKLKNLSSVQSIVGLTEYTFSDIIPSGVKCITVLVDKASSNGSSPFAIQVGNSTSIDTTGYESYAVIDGSTPPRINPNNCIPLTSSISATGQYSGVAKIYLRDEANKKYTFDCILGPVNSTSLNGGTGVGSKTLSGYLNSLKFTTVGGTDTFDVGDITIMWEF